MVNPRVNPPIIKMMMSERTPPTTEADTVLPLVAAVEPACESMSCWRWLQTCKHIIVYTRPNSAILVSPGNSKTALAIYRFPLMVRSNLRVMTRINLQLIHQFSTDVCS